MKFHKRYIGYLLMGFIAAAIVTFYPSKKSNSSPPTYRDYPEIVENGTLRVITEYNSLSYFAENDSMGGFDFSLINEFAKEKRLKIQVTANMSHEKRLKALIEGEYDIIAFPLPINNETKDSVLFTIPIILNRQVLVQRKSEDSTYISNTLQLANKKVHVVKSSPAILRLHNLSNEIGDTIYIEEVEKYGVEQLLSLVAHGEIDYLICEESIARSSTTSFPQLDISTPISFTQLYAWGINKNSPILLDTINNWLENILSSSFYKEVYQKYYND